MYAYAMDIPEDEEIRYDDELLTMMSLSFWKWTTTRSLRKTTFSLPWRRIKFFCGKGRGKNKSGARGSEGTGFFSTPRRKSTSKELKLGTRWGRCGLVGHWARECRNEPDLIALPQQRGRVGMCRQTAPAISLVSILFRVGESAMSLGFGLAFAWLTFVDQDWQLRSELRGSSRMVRRYQPIDAPGKPRGRKAGFTAGGKESRLQR